MRATASGNASAWDLAAVPHGVEHRLRDGQRIGQLLHRGRARFLQMVGADIGGVPFRHFPERENHDVLDEPHRGLRREDVGAARQIFLDDVVLHRARQRLAVHALLVRQRDIKRQQPRGGRVDRHGGVHLRERDAVEQRAHVAQMPGRNADLADLAAGKRMVRVVAGLRRQVEGDGKARLPLGKVLEIEFVRGFRGRVPRIGAENPGLVTHGGQALPSWTLLHCTIAWRVRRPNPFLSVKLSAPA